MDGVGPHCIVMLSSMICTVDNLVVIEGAFVNHLWLMIKAWLYNNRLKPYQEIKSEMDNLWPYPHRIRGAPWDRVQDT